MHTTEQDQQHDRPAIEELRRDASSRKRFLRAAGGGAAASAFAVFLAACGGSDDDDGSAMPGSDSRTQTQPQKAGGDLEIVNYALTLEYLEADFYRQVVDSGVVKDKKLAALAQKIGENEQEHVDALLATAKKLGKPAEQPKTAFEDVLAGGPKMVLATAATVENLGAAAYLGQADKIKDPEILAAALSIHTVEARHASALNLALGKSATPDGGFSKPATADEVLKQVKPYIASS